jgi:hypothetical protein
MDHLHLKMDHSSPSLNIIVLTLIEDIILLKVGTYKSIFYSNQSAHELCIINLNLLHASQSNQSCTSLMHALTSVLTCFILNFEHLKIIQDLHQKYSILSYYLSAYLFWCRSKRIHQRSRQIRNARNSFLKEPRICCCSQFIPIS